MTPARAWAGPAASLTAFALLIVAGAAAAQSAPVMGYRIMAEFPHDRDAFTQGLIFRDGYFFESTGRSPSTIRQTTLDGAIIQKRELAPHLFGEGLTDWGDRLITLTWRNRLGFVWEKDDLAPVTGFAYQGEGWGLTQDGRRLILSDGTATLRFLDPASLSEIGRLPVHDAGQAIDRLNELEWIDPDGDGPRPGEIWANVWETDRIARIDPETGRVLAWIDLTGLYPEERRAEPEEDVLNGIAWDAGGGRLFVTGKNWPTMFQIEVVGR